MSSVANKMLTKEEEVALGMLIQRYKKGDPNVTREQALEAHQKLFFANEDYVYKRAHEFSNRVKSPYYEWQDMVQDGMVTLCEYIWTYDPEKYNTKLITGLHFWLWKRFSQGAGRARPIKLSEISNQRLSECLRAKNEYESHHFLVDFDKEIKNELDYIAKVTGLKHSEIEKLLTVGYNVVTLSQTHVDVDGHKSSELIDSLVDNEYFSENSLESNYIQKEKVTEVLAKITKKEREYIIQEFDLNRSNTTLHDFCEREGINESKYRSEVKRIIKKLKNSKNCCQ